MAGILADVLDNAEDWARLGKIGRRQEGKSGPPVPMVRILPVDTHFRNPCRPGAAAFQWNYYEKHENGVRFSNFTDGCVFRGVLCPRSRLQLDPCQLRECTP